MTAIDARQNHTCAIVSGGAKCWGANFSGQLGSGNTSPSQVPVDVSGLIGGSNVTVDCGGRENTACAIVNGAVKCWGSNQYGQLGTGNITNTDCADGCDRLIERRNLNRGGRLALVCADLGRRRQVLGPQRRGAAGHQQHAKSISVPMDVVGLTSGVAAITAGGNARRQLDDVRAVEHRHGEMLGQRRRVGRRLFQATRPHPA